MHPKHAHGMANSIYPDQTAQSVYQDLQCLHKTCPSESLGLFRVIMLSVNTSEIMEIRIHAVLSWSCIHVFNIGQHILSLFP